MTDQTEHADWPECQPPEPPVSCRACGEPFTDARSYTYAFSSIPLCPACDRVDGQLEGARYNHDVRWPGNYALAALDLDADGQRRAVGLYAALGWCDPQDDPEATLRALLTDGAKPFPPDLQVRHDWIAGDQRQTCARCGTIKWDLRTSREWRSGGQIPPQGTSPIGGDLAHDPASRACVLARGFARSAAQWCCESR